MPQHPYQLAAYTGNLELSSLLLFVRSRFGEKTKGALSKPHNSKVFTFVVEGGDYESSQYAMNNWDLSEAAGSPFPLPKPCYACVFNDQKPTTRTTDVVKSPGATVEPKIANQATELKNATTRVAGFMDPSRAEAKEREDRIMKRWEKREEKKQAARREEQLAERRGFENALNTFASDMNTTMQTMQQSLVTFQDTMTESNKALYSFVKSSHETQQMQLIRSNQLHTSISRARSDINALIHNLCDYGNSEEEGAIWEGIRAHQENVDKWTEELFQLGKAELPAITTIPSIPALPSKPMIAGPEQRYNQLL
jgi:hypothetical protein